MVEESGMEATTLSSHLLAARVIGGLDNGGGGAPSYGDVGGEAR